MRQQPTVDELVERHCTEPAVLDISAAAIGQTHHLRLIMVVARSASRRAKSTAFRSSLSESGAGVAMGRGLEPKELRQLPGGIAAVVAARSEETEGVIMLPSRPLPDKGAGNGVAGVDPGGHCAPGRDLPSTGGKTLFKILPVEIVSPSQMRSRATGVAERVAVSASE